MEKKLKVGFIGTGFIAEFHAKGMEQVRQMELTGVLSQNSDNAAAFAARAREKGLGPAKLFSTLDEMAKEVDAIAIYTPNEFRVETMEAIAAAKQQSPSLKGVICEKPLGRNVKESARMVSLAKESGLLTSYFENQIHMKAMQAQLLQLSPQRTAMGPLMLVRSSEEHGGPHKPWFWDPTRQGGGVLSDMGCHSIAVGWYCLTPPGKPLDFLKPVSMSCQMGLLKWGQPRWRKKLLEEKSVDYAKTPAEDFVTGMVTFENPETKQIVVAQFTDSWMYEKQGLRITLDGMGPGYAFDFNSLVSPLSLFIGDEAAAGVANREQALEKSTASRGLLSVPYNEADLYGYVDENRDCATQFMAGKDGLLSFEFGLAVSRLVMAAYLSAERAATVDLRDPRVQTLLDTYVPLIQQGKGSSVLGTAAK